MNRLDPHRDSSPRPACRPASSRSPHGGAEAGDFSWCVADPALEAAPSEAPPPRLGSYRVGRQLGRGGGGAVFVARCTSLDRDVALKVLHAGASEDVARFLGEARAVARLRHPNIVAMHEVGRDQGRWFIAFDLVRGESLDRRIQRAGRLEPVEAARIALRLARALDYAHGRGLLHRDVKPANVVMAPGGAPLLADFGLVKDLRAGAGLTLRGDVLGTPSYMPPEQARGEPLDARCDVYALGATLHEMLAGRPPFTGPPVQVLAAVLSAPPAALPPLPPVDAALAAIVARCLQKEPAERYASARDLARDLERHLAGEPIGERRPGARASSSRTPAGGAPRAARRVIAASCVVCGLALAGALVAADLDHEPGDVAGAAGAAAVASRPLVALGPGGGGPDRTSAEAAMVRARSPGGGDEPERRRAPRVVLAPPGGASGPTGGGPQGRPSRRGHAPASGGLRTLGEASPLDVDDLGGARVAGDLAGYQPRPEPATGEPGGRQGAPRAGGAAADVAEVDSGDPSETSPTGVDEGTSERPAAVPVEGEPAGRSSHDDGHDDDHHGDDHHGDDHHDDDHHDDDHHDDYRVVLQPALDPRGYSWDSYYQPNTAPEGYVSALQPLSTGDLLVAAVPARVDGIDPSGGQARVELTPSSPVSSVAAAGGVLFVASADPAVPGAGDVHARDASGRWSLVLDGARREARVVALGLGVHAVVGDADAGSRVHVRDPTDGTWREAVDLGRCVAGAAVVFDDRVWIGGAALDVGAPARVFCGAGSAWRELREPFDGRSPRPGERQEVTALLGVGRHLFAAVAIFDPTGAPVSGEVMALDEDRFRRVVELSLDAPTALAHHDGTLYVGTRRGRLLFVARDGEELRAVSDMPVNAGVFTLLARDARTLLVGVKGPAGAEVLRRTARAR